MRLRFAIASIIAMDAHLRSPENDAVTRIIHDLYKKHWDSEYDEMGSEELSLYFLIGLVADPKPVRGPAEETIYFANMGLVEHLVRRASSAEMPDWSKIEIFEPIVEASVRADLAHEGALDELPVWQDNIPPEGLEGDWVRLRNSLDPSWAACLDALRSGQAPSADDERLALDSLAAMLNDQPSTPTS